MKSFTTVHKKGEIMVNIIGQVAVFVGGFL